MTSMTQAPFFPDREAYRKWKQMMPGITPCHEHPNDPHLLNPQDPCYPTTEGPYYAGPEYMVIRVGLGTSARYNVLVRVNSEDQADYRWFVPHQGQGGEQVFAAFLRNREGNIIGDVTLPKARAALNAFLDSRGLVTKLTRRL